MGGGAAFARRLFDVAMPPPPHNKDCLPRSQARDGVAWGGTGFIRSRKWEESGSGEFFSFWAELGGTKLLSGQMGSVHRRLLLLPQPLKNIPKVIRCNPSLYSDICLPWHTIPPTPVDHPSGSETLSSFTRHCFGTAKKAILFHIKLNYPLDVLCSNKYQKASRWSDADITAASYYKPHRTALTAIRKCAK